MTLTSLRYDIYSVLDNQKASKNTFQATTFKLKRIQGLFKDCIEFQRLFKEKWNSRTFQDGANPAN